MNDEQKKDFTRRLSQCNAGGMIVIMYDILFTYLDDARAAHEAGDREGMKEQIRNAQAVLDELMKSLNFDYEIAGNLNSLYDFCKRQLAQAMYQNRLDGLDEAEKILRKLYVSFTVAAEQDKGAPLMGNAEQVYAGMTYGRTAQGEESTGGGTGRGFLA